MKSIPGLLGALSILVVSLTVPPLRAATITPNILTDPVIGADLVNCSLRYAVEAINLQDNSTVPGCTVIGSIGTDDTIVLGEGTYVLTIPGNGEGDNQTGDLNVFNNDLPLAITGAGSNLTTVDASGISDGDRILGAQGSDFTISGMTLTGGDAVPGGGEGGALNFNETAVVASDLLITDNQAVAGGAISYDGNEGDVKMILEDSTIDGNRAMGGIAAGGPEGCGGGIDNEDGTMAIINSTISNNESQSGHGGGLCDEGNYLFLINSTVSSNTALTTGGGINTAGGLKGVYNVTIAFNDADIGGGLFKPLVVVPGGDVFDDTRFTTEIFNTIVAQNTANTGVDCSGEYLTGGNNLIGQIGPNDACTDFTDGVNDDQVGTDTAPIDPLLGPLADNGGPTQTHALLTGSTAIDRGNAAGCQALDVEAFVPEIFDDPLVFFTLTEDQRGLTRPVAILDPNVAICDIGAYELQVIAPTPTPSASPIVTPTPPPVFQGFVEGSGCSLNPASVATSAGSLWIGLGWMAGFLGLRRTKSRD